MLWLILIISNISVVISLLIWRNNRLIRGLADLRQGSSDFYRNELRNKTGKQLELVKEIDLLIQGVRALYWRYKTQRETLVKTERILKETSEIKDILACELSESLEENRILVTENTNLLNVKQDFEAALAQKLELQVRVEDLIEVNRKLLERNAELEYAINLESISMIEGYQAQNKLFSAIDDVRRSLTRILNPA